MAKRRANRPLEDENQNPKMSPTSLRSRSQAAEAIIQKGPLFDPVNYTFLIQIVNQLDPSSFIKFARTCKDLHHFCCNAYGIRVQFPSSLQNVNRRFHCTIFATERQPEISLNVIGADGTIRRVISGQELQKLQNLPFTIVIGRISFQLADSRVLEILSQFLRGCTRLVVEYVLLYWASDWNSLIQFLQDYNVKRLRIKPVLRRPVIPEDLLPFVLTKLDHVFYDECVADDLIVSATARYLNLWSARISKCTFMELLQKFANEDIVDWYIGRQPFGSGEESDPFIEACSEVMEVVKTEEIDWKNMEPSVLYNKPAQPRKFYLRKSDESIGKLDINERSVHFYS